MATTKTPRSPRNTRTGSNAMEIQKKINSDYGELVRDYKKLAIELWQVPVTKFVLGGAALGALVAVFRKYPEINTFVTDNVSNVRSKIDDALNSSEDRIS